MSAPSSTRLTVIDYESTPYITPEQAQRATRCIAEHARDADDARLLLAIMFGKPQVKAPRGFKGREPRDPDMYQPCGTEAAYQRHKRRGEDVDDACQKAASKSRVDGARRLRARRKAENAAKAAA